MANECIPLYRPGQDITATAGAAITGCRCVAHSAGRSATTGLTSVTHATAAGAIAGVSAYDAASGARVAIMRGKGLTVPITAGAAIAALAEVEVGTAGKVITKASGVAIGRAIEAAAGDLALVMVELY
jgi:hypothetical protein